MSKSKKIVMHYRSKYVDQSMRFVNWVDTLGLEQTWLGYFANRLEERFKVRRLALIFLFSLFLSTLLFVDFDLHFHAHVGEVAGTDIVAPMNFDFTDDVATEERRASAEGNIPPVFDFNLDTYEKVAGNIYRSFRNVRMKVREQTWPTGLKHGADNAKRFADSREHFQKDLGVMVPDHIWDWLVESGFSTKIETAVIRVLDAWSEHKIVEDPGQFISDHQPQVVLRTLEEGRRGEEFTVSRSELRDLGRRSDFDNEAAAVLQNASHTEQKNLIRFANLLLTPNVTYNAQETTRRQQKARDAVVPVLISIKKNQVLAQAGSVIQPNQIAILREVEKLKSGKRHDFISLMAALLLMSLMLVFFSYLRRFTLNRVKIESTDLLAMGLVTLLVVLITKAVIFFTDAAFLSKYGQVLPEESLLFLAPVAAGPMLVGLLISSGEVVWLFTVFLATALGIMVDMQFPFILVTVVGGIAAARGVFACKGRNSIYWAGVRTGLVNSLMIALTLLVASTPGEHVLHKIMWASPAGFLSGILSSLVAMMLIPFLETVFNYTTDVKLLELSNLNHPLLKEMIVKAPGTYHHSLVVGSMVEAGAEEIGANPLLAKVMAYYHDIGKMEHAAYFIENQRPGYNPHDNLSPHMSKTILIAHVKDGVEMGLRYKLGKPIIDGIWQHHGTTLISFFYNKALENQDEDIDSVSEEDFRYPGPKPQFREAALCMLADSIEAAARSLDDPTAARLQNLVKNIIQRKFMDGQLDECNLTLRDLSVLEDSFNRVLLGVYHSRIDYGKRGGHRIDEAPNAVANLKSVANRGAGNA
jgi:putative nucleotidyltransferase with HDIG domain